MLIKRRWSFSIDLFIVDTINCFGITGIFAGKRLYCSNSGETTCRKFTPNSSSEKRSLDNLKIGDLMVLLMKIQKKTILDGLIAFDKTTYRAALLILSFSSLVLFNICDMHWAYSIASTAKYPFRLFSDVWTISSNGPPDLLGNMNSMS